MADRFRYEVEDTRGRCSLVLLSVSPLSEAQVKRAALIVQRMGGLKRGRETTIDLGLWSADELRLLETQAP